MVNLGHSNNKILLNHESKEEYRIFFIGDSSTGAKTCLIKRIIENTYIEAYLSTIGIEEREAGLVLKNEKQINLKLYDTSGQERFRPITFQALRVKNVDFVVLGYDITDENSFDSLSKWINKIKENNINTKLIYLIGNKIDLEEDRTISKEDGERFAENLNLRFFEVSCKTGEGIEEFLYDLKNEIEKNEI